MTTYSRTRSKGESPTWVSNDSYLYQITNGAQRGHSSEPVLVRSKTDVYQDNPTPRYKTLVNAGRIVNTSMVHRIELVESSPKPLHLLTVPTNRGFANVGFIASNVTAPLRGFHIPQNVADEISRIRILANTKARANVASPDAQLLNTLAEYRQTLEMLAGPVKALLEKTKKLEQTTGGMRAKGAKPPEIVGYITDWWLAYRYGIMPLFYDVEGVIKALQAINGNPRETARARESFEEFTPIMEVSKPLWWGDVTTIDGYTRWRADARSGVLYDSESNLQSRLGMRLSDIPGAVWEGVRLSFVVDWVANVGNFVGQLTADLRADLLAQWSTVTVSMERETRFRVHLDPSVRNDTSLAVDPSGATTSETLFLKYRDPFTWQDTGVRMQFDMNSKRYADAFSLIWGRLTGNLRR